MTCFFGQCCRSFALRSNIKIGSRTLASYTYTDRTNYLSSLDYGNGDSVDYTYDQQGRVTKETYEDGDTVTYKYDNDGALATVTDSATGRTTTYYYDFTDRRMKYVESGSGYSHSVGYTYDNINNLTALAETINGVTRTTSYTYDDDNRVTQITNSGNNPNSTADDIAESYTYDTYGRIHTKVTTYGGATIRTETYAYVGDDSNAPSTQVESIQTVFSNGESITYSYGYDANGNIISTDDGSIQETTYVYDSANQLIRENDGTIGLTWMYDYDDAGNMTRSRMCFYSTTDSITELEEENYTYGDSSWGDLLTGWNGKTITSDSIGNMLSNGTWTYTWEHGRELASMTDGSTTWSFSYDANGMRTARSNGSRTYSYVYNGSSLSQLVVDGHTLRFTYDAGGRPLSLNYDGTEYYYVLNLQGDVRAIVDGSGNEVVVYAYDAWGNIRWQVGGSMKDTLGLYNPLRYRGYVYDTETGLYYVSSRYYDPEIGRFINADVLVSTGQGILGNNMFAYCRNNPVYRRDITGTTDEACVDDDTDLLDEEKTFNGGKISNDNSSSPVERTGGGHGNPLHKEKIEEHMDKLEKSGKFSKIYGNRSLKTAGLVGNQRPDVIAIGYDGHVEVWEFASPSQAVGGAGYFTLQAKIDIMFAANPSVEFHPIIHW